MSNAKNQTKEMDRIIKIASETCAKVVFDIIEGATGRKLKEIVTVDRYKETEERLRNLPVLKSRVEYNKERLAEEELGIERSASKSVTRFNKSGSRVSPEDLLDASIQDRVARIAADEYEIRLVEDALSTIKKDPFYTTVYSKYVLCESDDEIAEKLAFEVSYIRKNRGRLIRQLIVWLYGTAIS